MGCPLRPCMLVRVVILTFVFVSATGGRGTRGATPEAIPGPGAEAGPLEGATALGRALLTNGRVDATARTPGHTHGTGTERGTAGKRRRGRITPVPSPGSESIAGGLGPVLGPEAVTSAGPDLVPGTRRRRLVPVPSATAPTLGLLPLLQRETEVEVERRRRRRKMAAPGLVATLLRGVPLGRQPMTGGAVPHHGKGVPAVSAAPWTRKAPTPLSNSQRHALHPASQTCTHMPNTGYM